ncbi:hypothetical protein [Nocardia asteroides]|uniref:hypothetical protein n=1 Tax=Nocardia asteroides TaxID=1824 RepID=UPI001E37CFAE|nr:hypothetical protein [Nocardia asteroides]UGT59935.1 hypothetical protein LTT61_22285 [Nocardia asteroides]
MRDDSSTGRAEIDALAHQVATARGKLPLQHDNALLDVLSDSEVAAERELAEWIRAQRRGQRRRAVQDELDAEKRDRRADAALRRTEESDARWHRKALAARRRVASQDARIAQLYQRAEWSSRALIAVVVLGMVWAGVNVQRNLVPSGNMADPLYWLSYGIEAMISIPIIIIMITATTAARWGRELPRGRVILVELALLGTTIGLNAGPHLAAGELGRAAEFAIAPIMVGVVIWLHSWVAARYAQLIDDASVDLPIDSMVEAPAARTHAFAERYPAPQSEVDLAELVARAHAEFEQARIEPARPESDSVAPAPDRAVAQSAAAPSEAVAGSPAAPAAQKIAAPGRAEAHNTAVTAETGAVVVSHPVVQPAVPQVDADDALIVASKTAEPEEAQPQSSIAEADQPTPQPAPAAPKEHTPPQPSASPDNGPTHPAATDAQRGLPRNDAKLPAAHDEKPAYSRPPEPAPVVAEAEPPPSHEEIEPAAAEQPEPPRERPSATPAAQTDPDQLPPATPRIHLRAVTAPEPPQQEPLPFTEAEPEAKAPAQPELKELTSALTPSEPEPALPDHDPVMESDEAGAWAAAKTIVARGWSKVPVEQLAEILEMADRSRSAASIGAEMGLPRSVVDQAMQAAHKLSRTYAMTS